MQRSKRRHHPARDVSDAQLVQAITLPYEAPPERALQLLEFLITSAGKWDLSAYNQDPNLIMHQWLEAKHSTYDLGGGGAVMFYPLMPNDQATAHFYVWDPVWMKRTEVMRSVIRHAMRKWSLRRVTELVPGSNTLGCRNAERIGFTLEGKLRQSVMYTTKEGTPPVPGDVHMYGLLREEAEQWP